MDGCRWTCTLWCAWTTRTRVRAGASLRCRSSTATRTATSACSASPASTTSSPSPCCACWTANDRRTVRRLVFSYCSVALSRFDRPIGRGSFANEPVARDGRLRIVHRPLMTSLVHWLANEASASRSLDVNRPINTSRFFTSQLESKE